MCHILVVQQRIMIHQISLKHGRYVINIRVHNVSLELHKIKGVPYIVEIVLCATLCRCNHYLDIGDPNIFRPFGFLVLNDL
jgi:hypothetical protein